MGRARGALIDSTYNVTVAYNRGNRGCLSS